MSQETASDTKAAEPEFKGVRVSRVLLTSAFTIPNGGTETTISEARSPGIKITYGPLDVKIEYKGKVCYTPKSNVICAYE